jgi:hypothetical protein
VIVKPEWPYSSRKFVHESLRTAPRGYLFRDLSKSQLSAMAKGGLPTA